MHLLKIVPFPDLNVESLPHGWEKLFDDLTKNPYYVDHINQKSQWEKPTSDGKLEKKLSSK